MRHIHNIARTRRELERKLTRNRAALRMIEIAWIAEKDNDENEKKNEKASSKN